MYNNAVDLWPGLESHHLILIMSSLLQSPKSFCSPLNSGRRVKCHKDGAGGTRHTRIVLDPQTSDAGASRLSAATCPRTEEHALWRQKVLSNLWWLIRGRIKQKKVLIKELVRSLLEKNSFPALKCLFHPVRAECNIITFLEHACNVNIIKIQFWVIWPSLK